MKRERAYQNCPGTTGRADHEYRYGGLASRLLAGRAVLDCNTLPRRNASAAGPDETTTLDCGVNALFVLVRLEGRPVTVDRVLSALPPRHPRGYSMAELVAAARSLGLGLEGVQFYKGSRALDRPAIAFVKDARGGHYAVLRPVGTTGKMVQVLDPPQVPWIADYEKVFSAKSWTGRILIRRDPWIVRNAIPLLTALAGCGVLVASFTLGRRKVSAK